VLLNIVYTTYTFSLRHHVHRGVYLARVCLLIHTPIYHWKQFRLNK